MRMLLLSVQGTTKHVITNTGSDTLVLILKHYENWGWK